MKKTKIIFFSIIICLLFIFLTQSSLITFAQQETSFPFFLLTEPYLKFDAETEINAPLNVRQGINFVGLENLKGELTIAQLTEDRNYVFPNLSGEVCLSTGNCSISEQGLVRSSIQDNSRAVSIIIDEQGNVGIGQNPENKLDVAGRIQASDDICTSLGGGICLAGIEKPTSLSEATIQGEGTSDKVPVWKKDYQLGDSEINQVNRNIGIGMSPSYKLDVSGTVRMLGFRLPISPQEGYGLLSDDKGFGSWQPVLTPLTAGRDIAENFLINPDCYYFNNCPQPKDLVSINQNGFIEKSLTPYDQKLIGVISTSPAMTLGKEIDSSQSQPIALIGQAPVKVSLENGSIEIGDALTSSFLPGIAQKATHSGRTIGIALESLSEQDFQECQNLNKKESKILDCQKRIGQINVLISLSNNL